jgi:hypothetical protein
MSWISYRVSQHKVMVIVLNNSMKCTIEGIQNIAQIHNVTVCGTVWSLFGINTVYLGSSELVNWVLAKTI